MGRLLLDMDVNMDVDKMDAFIGDDPKRAIELFRQLKGEKAIREMRAIKEELNKPNWITISLEKLDFLAEGTFNFFLREPALVRSDKVTGDERVLEFELGKFILEPGNKIAFRPQATISHLRITQNGKVYFETNHCREEKIYLDPGLYFIIADKDKKLVVNIRR